MKLVRRIIASFLVALFITLLLLVSVVSAPARASTPSQQSETATPTPAPTALAAQNLSNNTGDSDEPLLMFDAPGILHLFWIDRLPDTPDSSVLHRQRSPQGSWSVTEDLSSEFETLFGELHAPLDSAGRVCLYFNAAAKTNDPGTIGVYRRCQNDAGWSSAEQVQQTPGSRRENFPIVAPDGSVKSFYIIGAGDLFFEDIELSDDELAYRPTFIQDRAGGLHAVWTRQGDPFSLEHRYSDDGGGTWRAAERLSDENNAPGGTHALVADAQGRVHLAWVALGGDVFYRLWSPQTGWSETVQLNEPNQNNSSTTLGLAVNTNGQAALTWQGANAIYYVEQRVDNTWTAPRVIAQGSGGGTGPALVIDPNGTRHLVWRSADQNADLLYASLQSIVFVTAAAAVGGLVYTSQFFQSHIHDPSILTSASPATLATNFALALILALAMGFFGNLLNATLEAHEARVAEMLGPLKGIVQRVRAKTSQLDAAMQTRRLGWLSTILKIVGLLLLLGIIYSFVDPAFDPTRPEAILAVFALTLSVGLINLVDDVAQYAFLRSKGETPELRVHAGNAVLAAISAFGSRFFQITPGILVGNPAGIEEVRATQLDAYLHLIAMGAVAVLALGAWFLSPLLSENLLLVTIVLLIFAVGVQTLFFEMLPLRNLHGEGIFRFNKIVWAILIAFFAWLFLTTMLNPDGEFLSSFAQPDMVTLAILVGLFCLFSAAVWFYFEVVSKDE